MKRIGIGVALLAVVSVAGCSTEAFKKSIKAEAETLRAAPDYEIGQSDAVTITVLGHEEFTFTGQVRPDGAISFPEHGEIEVQGKTPAGLRAELEQAFPETLNLRSPKVYVAVNAFTSKQVTVLGEVNRPGRYPYTGQMRVTDLFGLSIGPTLRAARNRALLFREIDGALKIYNIRLKDFFDNGDFSTNFYVRPGDILWVPRNGFAKFGDGIRIVTDPLRALFEAVGLGGNTVRLFAPAP